VELYIHSLNTPSWRGAQLKSAQGQLYLYLLVVIRISLVKLYSTPSHKSPRRGKWRSWFKVVIFWKHRVIWNNVCQWLPQGTWNVVNTDTQIQRHSLTLVWWPVFMFRRRVLLPTLHSQTDGRTLVRFLGFWFMFHADPSHPYQLNEILHSACKANWRHPGFHKRIKILSLWIMLFWRTVL